METAICTASTTRTAGSACLASATGKGIQGAKEGDRIGLLLDLDQGSMTVWKNDVQLGVMVSEGLTGPLCWAVSMFHTVQQTTSARIESAPAPAPPTEEELAAAKVWEQEAWEQEANDSDSDDE